MLHAAAMGLWNPEMIEELIEKGAIPQILNMDGFSFANIAKKTGFKYISQSPYHKNYIEIIARYSK